MLSTVRTVIVDEIHAVAASKRGSHLALTLERLQALCKRPPLRIGLSATQKPIEEVARFLVGTANVRDGLADCAVVECRTYDVLHVATTEDRVAHQAIGHAGLRGETAHQAQHGARGQPEPDVVLQTAPRVTMCQKGYGGQRAGRCGGPPPSARGHVHGGRR